MTEELVEYRYRQLFGMTHDQYLDEPAWTVDMLLAVDGEVALAQQEASRG